MSSLVFDISESFPAPCSPMTGSVASTLHPMKLRFENGEFKGPKTRYGFGPVLDRLGTLSLPILSPAWILWPSVRILTILLKFLPLPPSDSRADLMKRLGIGMLREILQELHCAFILNLQKILDPDWEKSWIGIETTDFSESRRNLRFLQNAVSKSEVSRKYLESCLEIGSFSLPMLSLRAPELAALIEDYLLPFGSVDSPGWRLEGCALDPFPLSLLSQILAAPGQSPRARTSPAPEKASRFARFFQSLGKSALQEWRRLRESNRILLETFQTRLLEEGLEMKSAGHLEKEEDVFFLTLPELEETSQRGTFKERIRLRKITIADSLDETSPAFPSSKISHEDCLLILASSDTDLLRSLLVSKGVRLQCGSELSMPALLFRECGIPSATGTQSGTAAIREWLQALK